MKPWYFFEPPRRRPAGLARALAVLRPDARGHQRGGGNRPQDHAQRLLVITSLAKRGLQTDFRVSASSTIQFPYLDTLETKGLPDDSARRSGPSSFRRSTSWIRSGRNGEEVSSGLRPGHWQVTPARSRATVSPTRMDILDVIAFAGGTRGWPRTRWNTPQRTEKRVSLEDLKKQTDPPAEDLGRPGDIVEVRESPFEHMDTPAEPT